MSKMNRFQVRGLTGQWVLKAIYDHGPISRADIARTIHLTPPSVSEIVNNLIAAGLVEEIGQGNSTGGKRPTLLSIVDDSHLLIVLDLAVGDYQGAVVNLRGAIQHRISLPLRERGGEAALGLVYELVDALMTAAAKPLLGIGIGAPGLVDSENGVVCRAVNVDWRDIPLRDLLVDRYGLPVYVANDCQLAALAEHMFGAAESNKPLVVISLGHGVGAGIVVNGQLLHGNPFGAGEIGHVVVEPSGEYCQCGHAGCLETMSSSRAVVRRVRAFAQASERPALRALAVAPEEVTLESALRLYRAGDPDIARVVRDIGQQLGSAAANLVSVLGPCQIKLAGSVTRFGDVLLDGLREELGQRIMLSLAAATEVSFVSVGDDIVLQGASALVISQEAGLL